MWRSATTTSSNIASTTCGVELAVVPAVVEGIPIVRAQSRIMDMEGCKERARCWSCPCGTLLLLLVIFLSTCWGMIAPTEYGLLKNGITGSVDLEKVYDGGRHFIGWGHEFVLFPSHLITVSFGNISTDTRYPIQARTGPGEDEDSGGQPLSRTRAGLDPRTWPNCPLPPA